MTTNLKWTDVHELHVTLKNGVSGMAVRKWAYEHMKTRSAIQANVIKEILLEGRPWEPDQTEFSLQDILECQFFLIDIKKEIDHNPWLINHRKAEESFDLLKRGANGDATAAIEYCKRELAGEVSHGAFA